MILAHGSGGVIAFWVFMTIVIVTVLITETVQRVAEIRREEKRDERSAE